MYPVVILRAECFLDTFLRIKSTHPQEPIFLLWQFNLKVGIKVDKSNGKM